MCSSFPFNNSAASTIQQHQGQISVLLGASLSEKVQPDPGGLQLPVQCYRSQGVIMSFLQSDDVKCHLTPSRPYSGMTSCSPPIPTPPHHVPVGVVVIVASWFISPVMAGLMSYVLYTILRMLVLRGESSYKKAIFCLPILLFVTLFVNMFFILYKVRPPSVLASFLQAPKTVCGAPSEGLVCCCSPCAAPSCCMVLHNSNCVRHTTLPCVSHSLTVKLLTAWQPICRDGHCAAAASLAGSCLAVAFICTFKFH